MIGIGIVGYGYWGPNLLRNFVEAPGSEVIAVCDLNPRRLAQAVGRYPAVRASGEFDELLNDPRVDAVAIATPVSTHFELALSALQAGKHVLVEKPLTYHSAEAATLVEEAARRRLVLMVDHTFVYTSAIRKIRELTQAGRLGQLYYYDSVRVNLGLFQHDVNVLWDLAVHDLAIMDYVLDQRPTVVAATGVAHVPNQPEDVAYVTCFFPDNLIAHFHVNWLAPVKIRRTLIGGDRQMIVYDDLEPSEKVKVYDKGITLISQPDSVYQALVGYRTGDMWAPQLDTSEALRLGATHFLDCIEQGRKPLTDGEVGLRVVRVLEAADQSMRQRGKPVEIEW